MRERFVILGLMAAIVAACSSTTDPVTAGQVALITGIHVPARAAAGDSIKLSFSYVTGPCDTALTVESRQSLDEVRFTARSKATEQMCIAVLSVSHDVGYVIAPGHPAPLRLIFSEPDGNDSVRVVAQ